jgi:FlaA1/EpsC-like NDP-sugar epimerase
MGSRGSVIPYFIKKREEGVIPITDERMTRFNVTLEEAVELVLYSLKNMWGGEIFVPKIPSYRITDLADAIAPGCRREIIGIRPGEKLHEEMITEIDGLNTIEFEKYFVILPSTSLWNVDTFMKTFDGKPCPADFRYTSGTNKDWLTVEKLRKLIKLHVDPDFSLSPAVY